MYPITASVTYEYVVNGEKAARHGRVHIQHQSQFKEKS